MKYLPFPSEYDKHPKQSVPDLGGHAFSGYAAIVAKLQEFRTGILAIEMYPGVDVDRFRRDVIDLLGADRIVAFESARKPFSELAELLRDRLTEDRVFGMMSDVTLADYYDRDQVKRIEADIILANGLRVVYGFGASTILHDHLVYVDITRWEIQLRFRKGMANFSADNGKEDPLRKFKRGYFADWRVADQIKKAHYLEADYLVSGDDPDRPVMITQAAFQKGIDLLETTPFRLIPYFDPGIWGGQWMKEVCNLPENGSNYAWSFDGVPEENALCLAIDGNDFVFPAVNLVFFHPEALLGGRVYERFGAEFPIRFDFLDTMGGGNLSLQVHPTTAYIQKTFRMAYTQDESYYILDATDESSVYLGVKTDIDRQKFAADLEAANRGEAPFDDEKYVNRFPVRKHDHLLIPGGTVHCSGKNTMVLEISATTYIFTFKLWDWGRLGLDGIPRPVHLRHGQNVIQYDRDTEWVKKNLINRFETINDHEIRTGLHELEFIETRRITVVDLETTSTAGSVNVLNLVEGRSVAIEAIDGMFAPFVVHYAETFIVPAAVGSYRIRNLYPKRPAMVIKAYVR